MATGSKKDTIFRVRFLDKPQGQPMEALVRQLEASHLPGLVCLRSFIFRDSTKMIILPDEEASSKRFRHTQSLHLPYHQILYVEEILDEPIDLHSLPFLKGLRGDETSAHPNP